MGKHKISITSFVDVAKVQSEEDLFSGLEDDFDEPESYTELPKRRQKQSVSATTEGTVEWNRPRTSSRGSSSGGGRQRRPSADAQAREDVGEFNDAALKDSDFHLDQESKYDDMREEGAALGAGGDRNNTINDDDSATTMSQDESTISGDTRSTIEDLQSVKVGLLCSDQTANLEKIVEMSKDVTNFVAEELEVDSFSQDISALKQEVVQNGMDHINKIDVAAMFAQFGANASDAVQTKELEKAPSDAIICDDKDSEEKKEDHSSPPHALPPSPSPPEQRPKPTKASSIASFLSEAAGDEGMEIPYLSCGDILQKPDPPEDSKKPAFLTRLLQGSSQQKIKDTSEWCPDVSFPDTAFPFEGFPEAAFPETDASSIASLSLSVVRVKLDDGDMVSVSADTVAKLQNCEWV